VSWLVAARAVRPLGSALAMQRRFVADASHELRTPLTILHTRAQLLQRRTSADAELAPAVDRLVAGTRTLTEIVNDLLLSAELQARPAHTSRVDLAEIAAAVADEFAPPAQHAGVHLHVRAETPVPVAGVAVALRRAVSALVDNALGHSHAGGTVTIEARLHEESALLIVTDDGEGIDPAAVRALTERFTRGPSASGRGRRFGLGLALVTEVVHSHGGALALHGMPGVGTTATITLPAAAATG
jgi:signal transduction histidine kinase